MKIKTKTTGLFIAIAIITSGLVALLALWRSHVFVEKEAVNKLQFQAQYQASVFENQLNNIRSVSLALEASVFSAYPSSGIDPSNIEDFKNQLIDQFLMIGKKMKPLSMWFILNPELVEGENTVSFFDKNRNGDFQREKEYSINNFDLNDPSMRWWTDAIKYGEVWTEPYYWKNWDMELISYSKAIFIDSTLIGCIGSDFDFSEKREQWKNIKIYNSGYISVMNAEFHFIIHPRYMDQDAKDTLPEKAFKSISNKTTSEDKGAIVYHLYNKEKVLAFQKLSNGWLLATIVPMAEIHAPIYKIGNSIFIILILVILMSIGIAYLFSKTITSPIYRLQRLFDVAKDGDLSVRSEIKTLDEFQMLGNQFNYFMTEMQHLVKQLKEKEQHLIIAKDKAEEGDRLKTAFLENLSHELRTPLTGIVSYSELLIAEDFTKEEKSDFLQTIQQNNDNLLQFVEDIITLSKLERGMMTSHTQKHRISFVLNSIKQEIQQFITNIHSDVDFRFDFSTEIKGEEAEIDLTLLIKIIKHIVDNAFKFTTKGEIVLGTFSCEQEWGIYIEDSGIGIPHEKLPLIFNKFFKYSEDPRLIYRGVGMGLSIAGELVHLLNGKIQVHSEPGKGSKFIISFKHY